MNRENLLLNSYTKLDPTISLANNYLTFNLAWEWNWLHKNSFEARMTKQVPKIANALLNKGVRTKKKIDPPQQPTPNRSHPQLTPIRGPRFQEASATSLYRVTATLVKQFWLEESTQLRGSSRRFPAPLGAGTYEIMARSQNNRRPVNFRSTNIGPLPEPLPPLAL